MTTARAVVRRATIRAYRVFVYSFVGSAGVGNIGPIRDFADVRTAANVWLLAAVFGLASALVAFLVATAESINGHLTIPGPHPEP